MLLCYNIFLFCSVRAIAFAIHNTTDCAAVVWWSHNVGYIQYTINGLWLMKTVQISTTVAPSLSY